MKKFSFLIVATLFVACQSQQKQENSTAGVVDSPNTSHHTDAITKVLTAHGGMDKWHSMKQMSFDLANGEHHVVELRNRKVRIDAENHSIGFDGSDVWISPAENEYRGNARFYHNLYFYFHAMPFVLGDPGITYSELPDAEMMGKTCKGILISYGDGVGDSPKDNYKLYYDPETGQMEWLMYTVTFRSQESSDRFNLIKYEDWREINGVKLPGKLVWYNHEDGVPKDPRREIPFTNVQLTTDTPDDGMFAKPEDSKVVGMPESSGE